MPVETSAQVPVTTAPFAGGSIPGLGSGQVPGIPSSGGAPATQTADPNQKAQGILQALIQAAQRKQVQTPPSRWLSLVAETWNQRETSG